MLDIFESIHSRMVLSKHGFILEELVLPGDFLYDYITKEWLEVKDVKSIPCTRLYEIHYSDGRIQYITDDEYIKIGDKYYTPEYIKEFKVYRQPISLHHVEYYPQLRDKLKPNPYIAGALFIYGDYNKEYINIPFKCEKIINDICNEFHFIYETYADKQTRVKFKYDSDFINDYITWRKFFNKFKFFARTHNIDDVPIPREYLYASIDNRIQFIRGAFDAGYTMNDSPDTVALNHWSKERLEWLQWLLWSLGISSVITNETDESNYRLDIIGEYKPDKGYKYYPGFFYDNLYIRNMIDTDNRIYKTDPEEFITIDYIEEIDNPFKNELIPKFYFDNNEVMIVDKNFLPKAVIK